MKGDIINDGYKMIDNAKVCDDTWLSGTEEVYGDAKVFGKAKVYGNAEVAGKAWIRYRDKVGGNGLIEDDNIPAPIPEEPSKVDFYMGKEC